MAGYSPTRAFDSEERASMDNATADLPSKAAKIRVLNAAGYSRSVIAAYLGISYQHVRNVLVAEAKAPTRDAVRTESHMSPSQSPPTIGACAVDSDGRVVLPKAVVAALGAAGSSLPWVFENNSLIIMGKEVSLRYAQNMVTKQSMASGQTGAELLKEERDLQRAREQELEQHG
jgi:hypothetical protein